MHTTPEPMRKEPTRFRESKKNSNVKKAEVPFEGSKRLPRRRTGKIRRKVRLNRRTWQPDNKYGFDTLPRRRSSKSYG